MGFCRQDSEKWEYTQITLNLGLLKALFTKV